MNFRPVWLAAIAAFLLPSYAVADSGASIAGFTLKNGLEVVVVENHRVPMVAHAMLYRVGSADDPSGCSGLAHFNEHMMFLGTNKVPAGEYAKIIGRLGGEQNAHTINDYTLYIAQVAKDYLPRVMELEADRMLNLSPPAADFLRERKVIIEERRMRVDNDPAARLDEQMTAALFRNHPYHQPVIGWLNEMEQLSEADVLAFHRRYYHPANAVLVLVGDITAAQARPLAEHYYGKLPAGDVPPRHWNDEPPQLGARHITLTDENVRQPLWARTYMTPSLIYGKTDEALPLYLFAQVLGGGTPSRLYQTLVVERKLAVSVSADYDGFRIGPGELQINATPSPGTSLEQLEAAVNEEIARALRQPPTEEELLRAKTLFKAETIYARDGLENMADIIAVIRAMGLPATLFNAWPQKIDAVTLEQLKTAAADALQDRQSVTGLLLPEAKP